MNLSAKSNISSRLEKDVSNTWLLLFVVAIIALRMSSETSANFSFFIIALYALFGRAQAIQALALSWLFSMLSDGVAPIASQAAVGRYAVIAAAALCILRRKVAFSGTRRDAPPVSITWAFGAFILIHSWFISPFTDVSVLKAIAWTVAMTTLLSAWGSLPVKSRQQLQTQLFGLLTAILLCSLPLLFLPLGYLRNGTGFQGVLSHPQAFGPCMALLGAFTITRLLAEPQPRWQDLALAAACLVLVIMSEARTAGLALVLGVAAAALVAPWMQQRSVRGALPGLSSQRMQVLALFAVAGLALGSHPLGDVLDRYLSKRGSATSMSEAYDISRGRLIEIMWENIEESPLSGIGFGIASDPSKLAVIRDPVLGLPTGASVEKGVLPIAVIEELGVPGFLFFMGWIWLLIQRAARNGVMELALMATLLLFNFGESTLFSVSGFGMINLIVLAWAVTFPSRPTGRRRHA